MILSLTFDDGFKKHFEVAKLLYKLDIQASFYLITGLERWRGETLLIKEPELVRKISEMGHEVGSHTHTHKNLTLLDESSIKQECISSIKVLEEILGERPAGLAYPYGAYDEKVMRVISDFFAYAKAMGKHNMWNENLKPYEIGSMGIRHLPKLLLKSLAKMNVNLVVFTFHHEPLWVIEQAVRLLKSTGLEIMPLYEALRKLSVV